MSTQSTGAIGQLGDGEAENKEHVEEDGDANGDCLWILTALCCKAAIMKLRKGIECCIILGYTKENN